MSDPHQNNSKEELVIPNSNNQRNSVMKNETSNKVRNSSLSHTRSDHGLDATITVQDLLKPVGKYCFFNKFMILCRPRQL